MATYMFMGKFSPEATKGIVDTGSDREAASRQIAEAAGGKLLAYYGMFGHEYDIVAIIEMHGDTEYLGMIGPPITEGVFESFTTTHLFSMETMKKAAPIAKKVRAVYRSPIQP